MSIPDKPRAEPFRLRDEPLAPSSSRRASESTAVWAVVLLIAATAGGYAVLKASRTEAPAQPAPVVAAPEPAPEPTPAPKPRRARPARPAEAIAKTSAPAKATPGIVHVEPERKAVDPVKGFDSGEAFENPPSPGRYGARSSGLLECNAGSNRPTAPDPSFGREPR